MEIIHDYFRPKTLPLIGIGFFFSMLYHFLPSDYHEWVNFGTIDRFFDPLVVTLLGFTVILCLFISHKEEWRGYWRLGRWSRWLHWICFPVFALVASFTAYLSGISLMFFGMINVDAGYPLDAELQYLSLFFSMMTIGSMDLFNSLMGKGIWFKIPPINKSPVRQYSLIDEKIKKHLPEKINKIVFYD